MAALAAAACSNADVVAPVSLARGGQLRAQPVSVMTRNMYVGLDVDAVIGALASADPTDDLPALMQGLTVLNQTDHSARIDAIADEIVRRMPDAVGLQEVSTIDVDLSGLGLPVTVHQDFLSALLTSLAAKGAHYDVGGAVTNLQATPFPGISVTDRDVLLVRHGRVQVDAVLAQSYSTNIGPVVPGVSLVRGFVLVNGHVDGREVAFASTHLESGPGFPLSQLRAAQATELAAFLPTDRPVFVMGDFNDDPSSAMYAVLAQAGLLDLWGARHSRLPGFTCCQIADLSNAVSILDRRFDFIFVRGLSKEHLAGTVDLVGERPSDRIAALFYPVWPSDHAGLYAKVVGVGGEQDLQL
jgi:endonuclease/exonuclease/phosphatase family metal-dependent hydrolase